jgi:hypothetical protein
MLVAITVIGLVVAAVVVLVSLRGNSSKNGGPGAAAPTGLEAPTVRNARVPAGARFVSPAGSDSGPGTRRRPWRTLDRALRAADPGETIVLRAGSYGARGAELRFDRSGTAREPITIMGEPRGRRPSLRGGVRIDGDYVRLTGLLFDGPTGPVLERSPENPNGEQVVVAILGSGVTISDSVVRGGLWHAGIYVEGGAGIRIVGNYIRDNGDRAAPAQDNLDHGIYWGRGSGLIADNVIEHNLARGIQLYPHAEGVLVTHNTIVGNGKAGIQLGQDATGNVIVNNIVAYNAGSGIRSSDLEDGSNRVFNNLVWANREGNIGRETNGLEIGSTFVADPRLERGRRLCPTPRSPAIDRALRRYSLSTDLRGVTRRGRRPDIGACELTRRERRSR